MIFIYDFDGVILNSDLFKFKLFKHLFKKETAKDKKKILDYHFLNQGINRKEKFKYILENILKKKTMNYKVDSLENEFKYLIKKKITQCKFATGSIKSLKFLKKKKIEMFIATGVAQTEINLIIKKLKLKKYFSNIYGYPLTKDKIIKIIKKKKNIKNSEIYFIGDSISDLKASKKTNITFLGRRTFLNFKILKNNKQFTEKNVYKIVKKAYDNHYTSNKS
jgi:HAD superfamily hydrolase (TIGR01549 family)